MDILDKIAKDKRSEVEALKFLWPLDELPKMTLPVVRASFREALVPSSKPRIIAEIKRMSPSKGVLSSAFDLEAIAGQYKSGGAAALSVLTDKNYFGGDPSHVSRAKKVADLPVLYKDFLIDPYQLYFARAAGADAVLLIVRLLTRYDLGEFIKSARTLGLDCLVETHTAPEIEIAVEAGAEIIGVNSRDLSDFSVTLNNAEKLGKLIPEKIIKVAESGISTPEEIQRLRQSGYNCFLVGEALMKSSDPVALLGELIAA